jgi:hypothetical protein
MTEAADRRATIEGEVLDIVSTYGGELIVAGPVMEAMVQELAALVERSIEHWAREQDAEGFPTDDPPRGSLPEGA